MVQQRGVTVSGAESVGWLLIKAVITSERGRKGMGDDQESTANDFRDRNERKHFSAERASPVSLSRLLPLALAAVREGEPSLLLHDARTRSKDQPGYATPRGGQIVAPGHARKP